MNTDIHGYLPELLKDGFPKSVASMRKIKEPLTRSHTSRDSIYQVHSDCGIDYLKEKRKVLNVNQYGISKCRIGKFNRSLLEDVEHDRITKIIAKYTSKKRFHKHRTVENLYRILNKLECDVVVCTLRPDGTNYVSLVHLLFPNGWSAEGSIGRSFQEIHDDVTYADGLYVVPLSDKFVAGIINSGNCFERVGAYSLRDRVQMLRHPEDHTPNDYDNLTELYVRFERQTVVSVPSLQSFIFFIHTHYVDCSTDPNFFINAIVNADPECYLHKQLQQHGDKMVKFLQGVS